MDYDKFKQRPFEVISKLGVRYTGVFDHVNDADHTICLYDVYNHGTEDRPTARKLAGSTVSLGWVSFRTDSIEKLNLLPNLAPPVATPEQDPILASVSQVPPPSATASTSTSAPPAPRRNSSNQGGQSSLNVTLERVQASLNQLPPPSRQQQQQPQQQQRYDKPAPRRQAQAPEVPETEFDFSTTQTFQKERDAHKTRRPSEPENGDDEDGDHPQGGEDVVSPAAETDGGVSDSVAFPDNSGGSGSAGNAKKVGVPVGYKKSSFFDTLSGEASRISRAEEGRRNMDTFGEEGGGQDYGQQMPRRGGYNQHNNNNNNRGGGGGGGGGGRGWGPRGGGAGGPFGRVGFAGRGGGGYRGRGGAQVQPNTGNRETW